MYRFPLNAMKADADKLLPRKIGTSIHVIYRIIEVMHYTGDTIVGCFMISDMIEYSF